MRRFLVMLVLAVGVAGCDSASDVTLLENATTTTVPVSFDVDALVGTSFPGGSGFPAVSIGYSDGLWLALGGNSPSEGRELWASNDGVIWEPKEYAELPISRLEQLVGSSSGVWLTAACDDYRNRSSCRRWVSDDGVVWVEVASTVEVESLKALASAGEGLVVLSGSSMFFEGESPEDPNRVFHSSDGGVNWSEVPLDGRPYAVTATDSDIIAWGSSLGEPTRWRLSTGWSPEIVEGLGSDTTVYSVAEAGDGSFVLVAGSEGRLVRDWFTSQDLDSWVEGVFPPDLPRDADLHVAGPFVLAQRGSDPMQMEEVDDRNWISTDGREWTEVDQSTLFEIHGSSQQVFSPIGNETVFASDGSTLIGVNAHGLVSDHPMVFSGPDYPGGWEELASLNSVQRVSGLGGERYFVSGGKLFAIADGSVVPVSDPPVVFPDGAHVDVTESALFVRVDEETWMLQDERWQGVQVPVTDSEVLYDPSISIVERDGVLITLTIEDGWVQKYVSEDGLRWTKAEVEPLKARSVYFDRDGWIRADPIWEGQEEFEGYLYTFSVDGLEWAVRENPWLYENVELNGESVTLHLAGRDVEFELPPDTTYLSTMSGWQDGVGLLVEKEGEPYLLAMTSDGDEIWARRDMYDPFLTDVWYDGAFLYGTATLTGDSPVVYVWNPDAE